MRRRLQRAEATLGLIFGLCLVVVGVALIVVALEL